MQTILHTAHDQAILIALAIAFFLCASIVTFDKRLTQAKRSGDFPHDEAIMPRWIGAIFIVEGALKIAMLILNWRFGSAVYIVGFLLAMTPLLETVGNVLMAPFKPRD